MTPVALRALDFVRDRISRFGFAPLQQEIADALGVSVPRANHVISDLVEAGHLTRVPGQRRGLALPGTPDLRSVGTEQLRGELARRGLTFDALAIPEPLAYQGRPCAATCCGIEVERGKLMCRRHWHQLPRPLRDNIVNAFYARDLDAYRAMVGEAIDLADAASFDRLFEDARVPA